MNILIDINRQVESSTGQCRIASGEVVFAQSGARPGGC